MGVRDTLRAWAQLLRLPNLFTVPGDPLAGFAIACAGQAALLSDALLASLASCLLYLGGLVLNDLMDLEEDRRERPQRPLPSGRIRPATAFLAVAVLFALGVAVVRPLGAKPTTAAAALALLVLLYNSPLRRLPVLGPALMGSCRAASFFLGVTAGYIKGHSSAGAVLAGFETTLVYIAAVTLLARLETTGRNPRWAAFFPAVSLLVGGGALAWQMRPAPPELLGMLAAGAAAIFLSAQAARRMAHAGKVLPPMIGQLISALVFWQTAMLFCAGQPGWALGIACGWPASRMLARRFYQS